MVAAATYLTYTTTATISVQVPRTVTADTDPQTIDYAVMAFLQHATGYAPVDTLRAVADALAEGGAITCQYTNEDRVSRARTLFPSAIRLTDDRRIEVKAYDTFRQAVRSFRIDRMEGAHALTLPCDGKAA
jgi:predicted DNA-binding transcriptional regulator YafY